jgi:hypothetical protein
LRKDIANVVELQPYIFLEEVIKLTTRVERQQKRGGVRTGVTTSSTTRAVSTPTRTWSTPKQDEKVEFSKRNTSSDSLKGKEKVTEPQHPRRSRDIKCFKCLGHGHIASECPNKRVMILRGDHGELISGDEVETEDEDKVQVTEQEEDFEPVKRDLLVVQRVLKHKLTLVMSNARSFVLNVRFEIRCVPDH